MSHICICDVHKQEGEKWLNVKKIKLLVVKFMVACQNSRHNAAEKIFFGHRVDHTHAWHITILCLLEIILFGIHCALTICWQLYMLLPDRKVFLQIFGTIVNTKYFFVALASGRS